VTHSNRRGAFATTRWTTVNAAGHISSARAATALAELCEIYWPPLYGYLRGRGYRPEEAQDLTQGFFARLLETRAIRAADPARGRFRAFLLTALKRYVINEYERTTSTRRGGRTVHFSLDFDEAERAYHIDRRDDDTPERVFDRKWAAIALDRALVRLREEYEAAGKGDMAQLLLPYLTYTGDLPSYRDVAAQLQLTEGAVKVAVHRLRQRYGSILRLEIAETVADTKEVESEMRELLRAVSR
jgi:RNA polymerase sigma-70 factor (ECF subfamily)